MRALTGHLESSEPSWQHLQSLTEDIADACAGLNEHKTVVFATELRLYFISKMDSRLPTHPVETVSANMAAFFAKEALVCESQHITFESSQSLEHLNNATRAIIGEFRRGTASLNMINVTIANEDLLLTLETEVSRDDFSALSSFCIYEWYIFDISLTAARHFSMRQLHAQAMKAFMLSKEFFEASENISETSIWRYVEDLCNFLDWAVGGPSDMIQTQLLISWACSQLRQRIGASDSVASRFKECISRYPDLLPHLPPDEPYTAGLFVGLKGQNLRQMTSTHKKSLPERLGRQTLLITNRLGIGSVKEGKSSKSILARRALQTKSPLKLSHRRQHSTEMALQAVLSVAAIAGGGATPLHAQGK
jgi:hypothetical protein